MKLEQLLEVAKATTPGDWDTEDADGIVLVRATAMVRALIAARVIANDPDGCSRCQMDVLRAALEEVESQR